MASKVNHLNYGGFFSTQRITSGELSRSQVLGTFLAILFAVFAMNAIYNAYFHPLSKVPGPRLATITNWWCYYYEILGILPYKCKEMAVKYDSDTIRIGPNKVVIHDSSQYDVIYRSGSKFAKDPAFYHTFPSASEGGTTVTAT